MKAIIFASVLSLLTTSIPIQAANTQNSPPVKENKVTAKININKADALALSKSVKGIGQKRAEAIIEYREKHGNFNTVADLSKVKGFSNRYVESHLKQLEGTFSVN
ncbi:MAG: helix-hairpin-helix domain-containing protein [Tatlockia sp.]|nr:helix-hairpin-helix domain-containing protein [Tatlockia sp.]